MEVVDKTYDKKFVSKRPKEKQTFELKMSSSMIKAMVATPFVVITIKLAGDLRKYKKPLLGGGEAGNSEGLFSEMAE